MDGLQLCGTKINMTRLKLLSAALTVSCGIGVLMAIIVSSNKNSLPRTAVIVPTQNPLGQGPGVQLNSPTSLLLERMAKNASNEIDRNTTSSITSTVAKKSAKPTSRNISELIEKNIDVASPNLQIGSSVTVKSGDTLMAISRRTGINVYRLAKINSLQEPYMIRPGQILSLADTQ